MKGRVFADFTLSEKQAAVFRQKVQAGAPNECWPFTGARDPDGYGVAYAGGRNRQATRVAWFLAHGEVPQGVVCHSCDNPPCCNPDHLWVGSDADNQRDSARKRRARGQDQTHCKNGHEFTPENTYWRPGKVASRNCRTCVRNVHERRKAEREAA